MPIGVAGWSWEQVKGFRSFLTWHEQYPEKATDYFFSLYLQNLKQSIWDDSEDFIATFFAKY